jgi:predicted Zn-dependent protease
MKKGLLIIAVFLAVLSCKKTPFTNRTQFNFMGNNTIFPQSFAAYNQFLTGHEISKESDKQAMVERVGQRIAASAQRYFEANGMKDYLKDYRWEYHLVQDDQVNAFCMPGGKIVIYTGILPVTQTEEGLAVVMGHEVAHALLNHGAERMSMGTVQQIGQVGVALATANGTPKQQQMWMTAYGLGSQIGVMLPFSRRDESEADEVGLRIMAIAGYNPDEGAKLWERMAAKSKGQQPPEMLSTHPSHETRIAKLRAYAPKAKEEAKQYGIYF